MLCKPVDMSSEPRSARQADPGNKGRNKGAQYLFMIYSHNGPISKSSDS